MFETATTMAVRNNPMLPLVGESIELEERLVNLRSKRERYSVHLSDKKDVVMHAMSYIGRFRDGMAAFSEAERVPVSATVVSPTLGEVSVEQVGVGRLRVAARPRDYVVNLYVGLSAEGRSPFVDRIVSLDVGCDLVYGYDTFIVDRSSWVYDDLSGGAAPVEFESYERQLASDIYDVVDPLSGADSYFFMEAALASDEESVRRADVKVAEYEEKISSLDAEIAATIERLSKISETLDARCSDDSENVVAIGM
jgi:uncharacterized small protein (DUF1192 family)